MDRIPTGSIKAVARMQQEMGPLKERVAKLEAESTELRKAILVIQLDMLKGAIGPIPDAHAQLIAPDSPPPRPVFSPKLRRKRRVAAEKAEA